MGEGSAGSFHYLFHEMINGRSKPQKLERCWSNRRPLDGARRSDARGLAAKGPTDSEFSLMSPGAKVFLTLAGVGTVLGVVLIAGAKNANAAPAKPKPQVPGSNRSEEHTSE